MPTTQLFRLSSITLFVLILAGVSCKKKKSVNPFTAAGIATVDANYSGDLFHYNIYYNQDNNVDSIILTQTVAGSVYHGYSKFSYSGNTITVTDDNNGTATFSTNANGMITQIADLAVGATAITYNGTEVTELVAYVVDTTKYIWGGNGNISTGKDNSGNNDTYFFDLKNYGQPGDALRIDDFLSYGRSIIRTNNLPMQIQDANTDELQLFSYTFDGQGRISTLTEKYTENNLVIDSTVYTYTYY